jgi:hypothetical protein
MNFIIAALIAFLLGTAVFSSEAEARCWWNGYNHCRYHHGYYNGYYAGWHHGYYRHGYWYR